jgi:hypothetical protein
MKYITTGELLDLKTIVFFNQAHMQRRQNLDRTQPQISETVKVGLQTTRNQNLCVCVCGAWK